MTHRVVPMRQLRSIAILAAAVVLLSSAPWQGREGRLVGTWHLSGPTLIDPDPREPIDRVLLVIEDSAAKAIFEAMPGAASDSTCSGEREAAYRRRTAGGLECEEVRGAYICTVAILLADGRTTRGYVCD